MGQRQHRGGLARRAHIKQACDTARPRLSPRPAMPLRCPDRHRARDAGALLLAAARHSQPGCSIAAGASTALLPAYRSFDLSRRAPSPAQPAPARPLHRAAQRCSPHLTHCAARGGASAFPFCHLLFRHADSPCTLHFARLQLLFACPPLHAAKANMWACGFAFVCAESQRPCMVRVPWCISACFEPAVPRQRIQTLARPHLTATDLGARLCQVFISSYLTLGILLQLRRLLPTMHPNSVEHKQLVASFLVIPEKLFA